MEKKVQILLSTYNGEKFLKKQIDSLLNQSYKNIEIIVRDDGSTDGTTDILKKYENNNSIKVYYENNIGLVNSFFKLLRYSDAEYIAFCDQDDIWLSDKITVAIQKLENFKGPALYAGNKTLIDAADNIIQMRADQQKLQPSFSNALVENICTGCTCVLNRDLTDAIVSQDSVNVIIHDWWFYLVAAFYGNVCYDEEPYIYYRQHGNNQIGAAIGKLKLIKAKLNYLNKSRGKLGRQLETFYNCYCINSTALDKSMIEKIESLEYLLNSKRGFRDRIKCIKKSGIRRQKSIDQLVIYWLILCNKLL